MLKSLYSFTFTAPYGLQDLLSKSHSTQDNPLVLSFNLVFGNSTPMLVVRTLPLFYLSINHLFQHLLALMVFFIGFQLKILIVYS